nr:reverse transcriptase domain-containing protein [Tanacetum cinerariifolium]
MSSSPSHATAPEATPQSLEQEPLSLVPTLVYPEYVAPADDDLQDEDHPLLASASPTTLSPDYLVDSEPVEDDPKEDPEEGLVDYPSEEEEDEKPSEEEEKEETLAPTLSVSPVLDSVPSSEETKPFEEGETTSIPPSPVSPHTIVDAPTSLLPPPSPLSPLSSPLPMIPSPPLLLPSTTHRDMILEVDMPPQKRARFAALSQEVKERVTDIVARHRQDNEEFHTRHQDAQDDRFVLQDHISTLEMERRYHRHMAIKMTSTRTSMSQGALEEMIIQRIADALATYDTNQSNGDDSHDSRSGGRRMAHTTHECTYSDFLKCQPLNFNGTEGAIGLAQWFEKMEFVFHISNYTVGCQVKFATCTLLGGALTWWNSHVRTIEHDAAYGMPWNLVVKGTDVESYTQRFQELILLLNCSMHPPRVMQIVVPPILAEHFELKHSLINMMISDQFFGLEKDNPHDHIRWGSPSLARKRTLCSILTWEDLVSKFINEFFPPSRTTNLRNEISNFQQRFDESFHEAWDRYKDLLRACPYYGFTELHQLDTFYNALNPTDHDPLNSAAGGNLLERRTQDVLTIIENKSE